MAKIVEHAKVCDLCCHESAAWAIGECDHPLCLRCTAKMRILCNLRDCPVCRKKIDKVVVCSEPKTFSRSLLSYHGDRKYGILFESRELAHQYEMLRENSCMKCPSKPLFRNFKQLRDHMYKTHDLHYCEICVSNLKLFPREFKAYSRQQLTKHRREGDRDDTSHKGHPQCKFCDDRYLDNDALHSHLRTEHFWCHICENNGKQDYYKDYPLLRRHFRESHYLCEEGACREEKLTCVFRTKIDLQAHRAATHTRGLSKAEVKQMKQLELGFSYGSGRGEGVAGPRSRGGAYVNPRSGRIAQMREQEVLEVATALSASVQPPEPKRRPKKDSPPPPTSDPPPLEDSKSKRKPSLTPEETQPPPGFAPPPGFNLKPAAQVNNSATVEVTSSDTASSAESNSVAPKLSTPPGFENVIVITETATQQEEESEWPEIVAPGSDIQTLRTEKQSPPESELTGLPQPPPIVTTPWAKRTAKPDHIQQLAPKKKRQSKPQVPPDTSEEFPPISSSEARDRPHSQDKPMKDDDKRSTSRKHLEGLVVERIKEMLNKDKDRFTKFKTLSGWYRNNEIPAPEYMKQCAELFGKNWQEIGPQVADVFPEEGKRRELLSQFRSKPPGTAKQSKSRKKNKGTTVWASQMPACRPPAKNMLNDVEYPSLASASSLPGSKVTSGSGAWSMVVQS